MANCTIIFLQKVFYPFCFLILELLKEQGKEEGLKQGKEEGIQLGVQRGEQQERKRGLVNAISLVVDMGHDLSVAVSRSAKKYQMSEAEVWSIWNAKQE